jgi:hypothetical protein
VAFAIIVAIVANVVSLVEITSVKESTYPYPNDIVKCSDNDLFKELKQKNIYESIPRSGYMDLSMDRISVAVLPYTKS